MFKERKKKSLGNGGTKAYPLLMPSNSPELSETDIWIASQRQRTETDLQWQLRRSFLEKFFEEYPRERLTTLSMCFTNVVFLGTSYMPKVMEAVEHFRASMRPQIEEVMSRIERAKASNATVATGRDGEKKKQAVKSTSRAAKAGAVPRPPRPEDIPMPIPIEEMFKVPQMQPAVASSTRPTRSNATGSGHLRTSSVPCPIPPTIRPRAASPQKPAKQQPAVPFHSAGGLLRGGDTASAGRCWGNEPYGGTRNSVVMYLNTPISFNQPPNALMARNNYASTRDYGNSGNNKHSHLLPRVIQLPRPLSHVGPRGVGTFISPLNEAGKDFLAAPMGSRFAVRGPGDVRAKSPSLPRPRNSRDNSRDPSATPTGCCAHTSSIPPSVSLYASNVHCGEGGVQEEEKEKAEEARRKTQEMTQKLRKLIQDSVAMGECEGKSEAEAKSTTPKEQESCEKVEVAERQAAAVEETGDKE